MIFLQWLTEFFLPRPDTPSSSRNQPLSVGAFFEHQMSPNHRNRGLILTPILVPLSEKKLGRVSSKFRKFPKKNCEVSVAGAGWNQEVFTDFTQVTSHHRKGDISITSRHLPPIDLDQSSCTSCTVRMGNVALHGSQPQSWSGLVLDGCGSLDPPRLFQMFFICLWKRCLSHPIYKSLKMVLNWGRPKFCNTWWFVRDFFWEDDEGETCFKKYANDEMVPLTGHGGSWVTLGGSMVTNPAKLKISRV